MTTTNIDLDVKHRLHNLVQKYPLVQEIVDHIHAAHGRALLVGGAVRDLLLGLEAKDMDIEVHGLSLEALEKILKKFGPVSLVGKAFGVLRVHGLDIDWSLPRMDAAGRKPDVTIDPHLNMKEAFARRDLTINAMGIDLVSFELIDPFHGQEDLKAGILRAPDEKLFIEDPLRFYRVMQFIGRFQMQPSESLNQLCASMNIADVSVERIEAEFEKLLLKSERPSLGIRWLQEIGRLHEILPELYATINVPQDPRWHPEGDVFEHSMQALDAMVRVCKEYDRQHALILLYTALCHDVGKAVTTKKHEDDTVTSYNHEVEGVEIADRLMHRMMRTQDVIKAVLLLIRHHMQPIMFLKGNAKAGAYKRLAKNLAPYATINMLADLALADRAGRNPEKGYPLTGPDPEVEEFRTIANQYHVLKEPEAPLLLGRDLMDCIKPGPRMGQLLKKAYAIQINEGIVDKEELKRRALEDN